MKSKIEKPCIYLKNGKVMGAGMMSYEDIWFFSRHGFKVRIVKPEVMARYIDACETDCERANTIRKSLFPTAWQSEEQERSRRTPKGKNKGLYDARVYPVRFSV